jgi:hypothetical protein
MNKSLYVVAALVCTLSLMTKPMEMRDDSRRGPITRTVIMHSDGWDEIKYINSKRDEISIVTYIASKRTIVSRTVSKPPIPPTIIYSASIATTDSHGATTRVLDNPKASFRKAERLWADESCCSIS